MRLSERPVLTEAHIAKRVREIANEIAHDYRERELTVVVVLKGGAIFAADLCRELRVPLTTEYVRAKSYSGTESNGQPHIEIAFDEPLKGKHVLVVEDILDTGRTTSVLMRQLAEHRPASLALCVFLNKPVRRVIEVQPNYSGFTLGDRFVVGYGLDYEQRFRNLPAIYDVRDFTPSQ